MCWIFASSCVLSGFDSLRCDMCYALRTLTQHLIYMFDSWQPILNQRFGCHQHLHLHLHLLCKSRLQPPQLHEDSNALQLYTIQVQYCKSV
jgi:hypothetical protein